MRKYVFLFLFYWGMQPSAHAADTVATWSIHVLPASVRIDPSSARVWDHPYHTDADSAYTALLNNNWVYDGKEAKLAAARGEYVSFQLVLTNHNKAALKGITVSMTPFQQNGSAMAVKPELFLEWSVEVKSPSTGYPKAALGTGWYPDALIPFSCLQQGTQPPARGGWIYPLQLPDFNNRIPHQQTQIFWVDQFIPYQSSAKSGLYRSTVNVTIDGTTRSIPVQLTVRDFSIPNDNLLKASLQHEGFVSSMNDRDELQLYQLMKRNRVCIMDPTYKPELKKSGNAFTINWQAFDKRLKKYFTGEAFTTKYGYTEGPGYGSPLETFLLPFDVYGKQHTKGWPDVGTIEQERQPANRATYANVIGEVRNHLRSMIDTSKTDLTVYLNGLDESYFPEAWQRMSYYGKLFRKAYPEAGFRVDGSYNDSALQVMGDAITAWAVHTIDFSQPRMKQYNQKGIHQWLYGPMIYESQVNSWVGSSTFTDLPLVNDRAISWSVWKYRAHSWISWGMGAGWRAAWYDSETWKSANDGGNAEGYDEKRMNGNAMLVYSPGIIPNVGVACPSIRLKTMRDGVQEFEYMRKLAAIDNSSERVDAVVNGVVGQPFGAPAIGHLDVWSYDPKTWDQARERLGKMIEESTQKNH